MRTFPQDTSRQVITPTTTKRRLRKYRSKDWLRILTSNVRLKLNAKLTVGGTVNACMQDIHAFTYIGIMRINCNMVLEFVEVGFGDDSILYIKRGVIN